MEDISKEEKQNFLRVNILEKGYDVEQFVLFLQSKKGEDGADISNWSINDLNIVVKEFTSQNSIQTESNLIQPESQLQQQNQNNQQTQQKNEQTQQKNEQTQQNNEQTQLNNEQIQQNNEQTQQKNEQKTSTIDQNTGTERNSIILTEEDFGLIIPEYIKCLKSETTELSKHEIIEIRVKEPKKVNKGFFSKTFINFLVTTNPINANVRRKHTDFVWLRERLSVIFNLNVLPHLIKKVKVDDKKMEKKNEKFRNIFSLFS